MYGGESFNRLESKQKKKKTIKVLTMIVIILVSINFTACSLGKGNNSTEENSAQTSKEMSLEEAFGRKLTNEELDMFRKLLIVKDNLTNNYYEDIDEQALAEGAIKGMASSIGDPYTSYLNEEEWERLNQQTEGSYVGVGIQVGVLEEEVVIITAFEGSPAAKAGIKSGDVIVKVNGEDIGSDVDKAVGMMKGTKGKEVKLTVEREGKGLIDFDMVADEIILITVKGEMVNDSVGYISISTFDENTGNAFKEKLGQLQKEGAKGLILDLRDNPGGLVSTSVEVASNFIEKGETVVYTVDKNGEKEIRESVGGNAYDMPVVILTNEYTASASEIVTGALKDYEKATVVGEKTFGKGIVQQVFYRDNHGFGDGTALKVTVSSYYTPDGISIHEKGIEPDVEVIYPDELYNKEYNRAEDPQFNEALKIITDKIK